MYDICLRQFVHIAQQIDSRPHKVGNKNLVDTPPVEVFQIYNFGAGSQQATEKQEKRYAPIQERSYNDGSRAFWQSMNDDYCGDRAAAQQLQIRIFLISSEGGGNS